MTKNIPQEEVLSQTERDAGHFKLVAQLVRDETYTFTPDDPDYYAVTFVKGAFQRFVVRDIPTLEEAKVQAEAFNREHGKYGRRSLIHAVKGFRSYDASALCRD